MQLWLAEYMRHPHNWINSNCVLDYTESALPTVPCWTAYDAMLDTFRSRNKWPPICRRRFKINFILWKLLYFNLRFIEISSHVSGWQYASLGSDKDRQGPGTKQVARYYINLVCKYVCTSHSLSELKRLNRGAPPGPGIVGFDSHDHSNQIKSTYITLDG